jgi:uncharacterized protein YhfF
MTSRTDLPLAEFAFPGPVRDALVAAILAGTKTSTTGLHEELVREGAPIGSVGDRELVVDSDGHGVAVIETTEVEVKRMGDVDLLFAIEEGEGFETLDEWREAHVRFFTSPEMVELLGDPRVLIDDDTLVVCYRFRLLERL